MSPQLAEPQTPGCWLSSVEGPAWGGPFLVHFLASQPTPSPPDPQHTTPRSTQHQPWKKLRPEPQVGARHAAIGRSLRPEPQVGARHVAIGRNFAGPQVGARHAPSGPAASWHGD